MSMPPSTLEHLSDARLLAPPPSLHRWRPPRDRHRCIFCAAASKSDTLRQKAEATNDHKTAFRILSLESAAPAEFVCKWNPRFAISTETRLFLRSAAAADTLHSTDRMLRTAAQGGRGQRRGQGRGVALRHRRDGISLSVLSQTCRATGAGGRGRAHTDRASPSASSVTTKGVRIPILPSWPGGVGPRRELYRR